jgi:hypothetical protein
MVQAFSEFSLKENRADATKETAGSQGRQDLGQLSFDVHSQIDFLNLLANVATALQSSPCGVLRLDGALASSSPIPVRRQSDQQVIELIQGVMGSPCRILSAEMLREQVTSHNDIGGETNHGRRQSESSCQAGD